MTTFEETRLPGVGIRHDFVTEHGRRIGVITRHSGRRELLIYDQHDPDACRETLNLTEADRSALAELLGGSQITARLGDLQQQVEGLAIDWLALGDDWWAAGHTITDTQLRRRTGVTNVAIIRGQETVPAPAPNQRLDAGDTLVIVGTPAGIEAASAVLRIG